MLEILCPKNRSKKYLILDKREHFKNGQNWPRCMGYTPCKMVSFCQKFKTLKRYEKRLCDHFKNVECKKALQETPNLEKRDHFQNGQNWPRCMGYSPCKMVSLGQNLKAAKRCTKRLCDNIKNVVCKKQLQKTPNIRKMRAF